MLNQGSVSWFFLDSRPDVIDLQSPRKIRNNRTKRKHGSSRCFAYGNCQSVHAANEIGITRDVAQFSTVGMPHDG